MRTILLLLLLFLLLSSGCIQLPWEKPTPKPKVPPAKKVPIDIEKPPIEPPTKKECTKDEDCQDEDLSTIDICDLDSFACKHFNIVNCISNDGYCPESCNYETDKDCKATDKCLTNADCLDEDNSTTDLCIGTPKFCYHETITQCKNNDKYCPSNCNFQKDNDCEKKDLCATDVECDDNSMATIDQCQGIPKICVYFKTPCKNDDNFCPENCSPQLDNDCKDECFTAKDCSDYNPATADFCSKDRPRKCYHTPQESKCISFDEQCTEGCQANEDLDCRCLNDDEICPKGLCSYSTDNDCPESDFCNNDSECKSPHFFTQGFCEGEPRHCVYRFNGNTNCGIISLDSQPGTFTQQEVENCFCNAFYSCIPSKVRASSTSKGFGADYETKEKSGNNCVTYFRIDTYKGNNTAIPVGYTATCNRPHDANASLPLDANLLEGNQCSSALRVFFNNFPGIVMSTTASCSGNFVNFYKDTNQWQE